MLLKRQISLFLAMILIAQPITVLGSENANSSDVLLSVTPQVFSAVVPTQLPVWMSASGVITVAEDVNITNASKGPIRVDDIELTNVKADWELVNFDSDFSSFKVGSKKLAMSFNGDKSLISGDIPLGASNLTPIDGLTSMPLNYDAKIPAQSTGLVDEIPANVVFTLKWHEVGSADIEENNPNIYEFVSGDEKTLTINFKGIIADNDTVVWSSSNEAVATVADYVSKGRARPIDGSKQCLVTAVGSGKATITGVLGDGTTNSFDVVVADKGVVSIDVTKSPDKVAYIEGENFSSAGMIVVANYNNGTSVDVADYVIADGNNLIMGQNSVTISYNSNSVTQVISVVEKSLTNISITTPPDKIRYVEGNDFDAAGMVVTAYYDNGTNKAVVPTLSRDTNLAVGQTDVDVNFEGKAITQNINVETKSLANIIITSPSTKTSYIEGNGFDATGMVVTAYYNNGTSAIVIPTLGRNTNLAVGQTSVDVSFGGKTVTQAITVAAKILTSIAITTPPSITNYVEGNHFDKTNMVVTAYYDNGMSESVTPILGRYTNLIVGQTSVDVSFGNKTVTQDITVVAKILTGISITTPPTKTIYIEGENFDPIGMVVTASYGNALSDIIVPVLSKNTNLGIDQTNIDISYNGEFATQLITVRTITTGDKYVEGNYEYSYGQELDNFGRWRNGFGQEGWGVRIINPTKVDYVNPLTIILNKPVTNMSYLFLDNTSTTLNLISWDTANITNMQGMFRNTLATSIDGLNNIRTSNVTDMSYMFSESNITSLNLSRFSTINVTSMSGMFSGSQAKTINMYNFNTSKVTNMRSMFEGSQATFLYFYNWDTSNVTNMSWMFKSSQATNLATNFNTAKVLDMRYMFNQTKTTNLNLSSFDMSNVDSEYTDYMFYGSDVKDITARTQVDADRYKESQGFPTGVTITIKT